MIAINSLDNQKIKQVKRLLTDKKCRSESSQYVAEGVRWVYDALKIAPECVDAVFYKESMRQKLQDLLECASQAMDSDRVYAVSDVVFDKAADTMHNQGILAVLKKRTARTSPICQSYLILDRIRDPGNLGTIIRTAAAAGFCAVVLADCVDAYAPKVVRSSMSALLSVDIIAYTAQTFPQLKKQGYTILAADMNGANVFTNTEKFDKIALIIGSEADGICEAFLHDVDKTVSIPMQHVESLNAAVSAGILMYQLKHSRELPN